MPLKLDQIVELLLIRLGAKSVLIWNNNEKIAHFNEKVSMFFSSSDEQAQLSILLYVRIASQLKSLIPCYSMNLLNLHSLNAYTS